MNNFDYQNLLKSCAPFMHDYQAGRFRVRPKSSPYEAVMLVHLSAFCSDASESTNDFAGNRLNL